MLSLRETFFLGSIKDINNNNDNNNIIIIIVIIIMLYSTGFKGEVCFVHSHWTVS